MTIYLESIAISILCIFLLPEKPPGVFTLCLLLVMLSLYCFELFFRRPWLQRTVCILALAMGLAFTDTVFMLPLFLYITAFRKEWVFAAGLCLPLINRAVQQPELSAGRPSLLPVFGAALLCAYLGYRNRERLFLKRQILALRDNSVEQEMALLEKNRKLLENQDGEIYIATLQERNRIAREIHDNVGHMLSRSILQVGALLAITKDTGVKAHLTSLKETLDEAMVNIRNSVHDLHDESVDLQSALAKLISEFTFCPVDFRYEAAQWMPKEIKYCFLAIAKEALNNVMKHSSATAVELQVREHPGFYRLLITDNGTPASPGNLPDAGKVRTLLSADRGDILISEKKGIGLMNMKERVDALQGVFDIRTDKGFQIFVSVPKLRKEKP